MAQYIGSTTPLNAGQTYTSGWLNTDYYGSISGAVFSDQAGTVYIEQSGDQVNADISASYTTTANEGQGFVEQLLLPYVRLRFTNTSASNQTTFRLFNRFILGNQP